MHLNEKHKEKLNWVLSGIVKFNNSIKVTLFPFMWKTFPIIIIIFPKPLVESIV